MPVGEGDALATRGLLSINPDNTLYEVFSDMLATHGMIFLVTETFLLTFQTLYTKLPNRDTYKKLGARTTYTKLAIRDTYKKLPSR
jgi:hypothetical protein